MHALAGMIVIRETQRREAIGHDADSLHTLGPSGRAGGVQHRRSKLWIVEIVSRFANQRCLVIAEPFDRAANR
jgi:hypothetical protein